MQRTRIRILLGESPQGQKVRLAGWLRTRRDARDFSFLEINDGSTIKNIQVIASAELSNYESTLRHLGVGASLAVEGELAASAGKGQSSEVRASRVEVLGGADSEFPIQKKRHSFEFLREIAHLRPRTNTLSAVLRLRSRLSFAIHDFFQQRDFHYIHTPIITGNDCEGAGQMFRVTAFDPDQAPRRDGKIDYAQDFFGLPVHLTVSGQLAGEACALALGDIYTFGPTFRAENSNTSRHLAEFWMVEPEMAFATLEDDAALAEDFLRHLFRFALEQCRDDMEFFNKWIDPGAIQRLESLAASSFARLTYTEAIAALKKSGRSFEFPVEWGRDLQSEHERYLTEEYARQPLIVVDYPREIKAFYMKLNDDGKTVRAMDVLAPGIGEIIGGSEREDRVDVLTDRMHEFQLNTAEYRWYLELRRWGSTPHAGFGLGLERLVQFISGMENIRDVIPFPRTPGHARY
ncbi:MAG: asparagine--tRNA ligase [Leptospirales bacterium]|nr:asparagine--tRNA ligase [Leptospirales bacterium]